VTRDEALEEIMGTIAMVIDGYYDIGPVEEEVAEVIDKLIKSLTFDTKCAIM